MKNINLADIKFVRSLLPSDYKVAKGTAPGTIDCWSNIGIPENQHGNKRWERFKLEVSRYFGRRFREFNHTVCAEHRAFSIHLKK